MSSKKFRSFWIFVTGAILVLGFQNCGSSVSITPLVTDVELDSLLESGLESLPPNHSVALSSENADGSLDLYRVTPLDETRFNVSNNNNSEICSSDGVDPYRELANISSYLRVSNPDSIDQSQACDFSDRPRQMLVLGSGEDAIYLIFKDFDSDNCLSDDPKKLELQEKKVYVVNNVGSEEINDMVFNSKQMQGISSCDQLQVDSTDI